MYTHKTGYNYCSEYKKWNVLCDDYKNLKVDIKSKLFSEWI